MRVNKIIKYPMRLLLLFFENLGPFGIKVATAQVLFLLSEHIGSNSVRQKIYRFKHETVLGYLEKEFASQIKTNAEIASKERITPATPFRIWQCWWQGSDHLSGITKLCTNSVRVNSRKIEIVFITLDNYADYIQLPEHVIEKVNNGTISLTFFSDILRVNLLKKYGGLWIDATVLLTDKIMDEIITRDFITCPEKNDDLYFVSKYKWNTSILGGKVNLPIFSFVANMFNDYWAKENKIIDYYLFDYLIALGYRNVPKIREEIDSHPFINPQKHKLQNLLNKPYSENEWRQVTSDTSMFKLSRKVDYDSIVSGKKTFYQVLLERFEA